MLRCRQLYQLLDVLLVQVAVGVEVIHPEGRQDLHFPLRLWREHVEQVEELVEVKIARAIGREDLAEPRPEWVVGKLWERADVLERHLLLAIGPHLHLIWADGDAGSLGLHLSLIHI